MELCSIIMSSTAWLDSVIRIKLFPSTNGLCSLGMGNFCEISCTVLPRGWGPSLIIPYCSRGVICISFGSSPRHTGELKVGDLVIQKVLSFRRLGQLDSSLTFFWFRKHAAHATKYSQLCLLKEKTECRGQHLLLHFHLFCNFWELVFSWEMNDSQQGHHISAI